MFVNFMTNVVVNSDFDNLCLISQYGTNTPTPTNKVFSIQKQEWKRQCELIAKGLTVHSRKIITMHEEVHIVSRACQH